MTAGFRAVAAWTSPAAVAALAAGVYAGEPVAPFTTLALVAAALIALLHHRPLAAGGAVAWARAATAAAVLGASLRVLGDTARVHGLPAPAVVVVAAVLAVALTSWPTLAARAFVLVPVGVAALLVVPLVMGLTASRPPWRAWTDIASRPALIFAADSMAVLAGQPIFDGTTLVFTESHRVVAVTPGTYRTIENDGGRRTVREWRLGSGEALTLRPGDRLVVEAGSRVRFEPGKRVPGVAASGVAWASVRDQPPLVTLVQALAVAVTLVGGALALIPAPASGGRALAWGPAIVVLAALDAAAIGVYAVWAAPEVGLGAPWPAPLVRLPAAALPPAASRWVSAVVAAGLLALFLACAGALREILRGGVTRVPAGWRRTLEPALWTGVVALAVAMAHAESAMLLTVGFGLGAAAVAAPGLAAQDGRAALVGSLAGAMTLAAVVLVARGLWADSSLGETLARYPAVVAAPLAWTVSRLQRGDRT
jgi:hypothetical protein